MELRLPKRRRLDSDSVDVDASVESPLDDEIACEWHARHWQEMYEEVQDDSEETWHEEELHSPTVMIAQEEDYAEEELHEEDSDYEWGPQ